MAPKILAIETALNKCSVAILVNDELKFVHEHEHERAHAEQLAPMISAALKACALKAGDLTAVAVSSGPGSYTGLRIGVSTAKGICYPTGASLVSVSTLKALALQAASPLFRFPAIEQPAVSPAEDAPHSKVLLRPPNAGVADAQTVQTFVAVAMRARARELYWAVLGPGGTAGTTGRGLASAGSGNATAGPDRALEVVVPTTVTNESAAMSDLSALDSELSIVLCGNAADFLRQRLTSDPAAIESGLNLRIRVRPPSETPLAAFIAMLGAEHCLRGNFEDVASFEPAYLKEFVAGKRKGSIFDQLQF